MRKVLMFMFLLLISIVGVNAISNDSSLIGYWEFNNLSDSSGNGNTLIIGTGSPTLTTDRNGVSNSAYQFNGADGFSADVSIPTGTDITLSMWFKADVVPSTTNKDALWSAQATNIPSTSGVAHNLRFQSSELESFKSAPTITLRPTTAFTDTTSWHHIVLVFVNGGTSKLYVDNVLKDSIATGTLVDSFDITLGGVLSGGLWQDFFNGKIDQVSYWNRSFNSSDVTDIFNNNITFGSLSTPPINTTPTPAIISNLTSLYNTSTINVSLNTTTNVNMSYVLNGISPVPIYDITGANFLQSEIIISLPRNIIFNNDGSKMYTVSGNGFIEERSLSTNYDITTAFTQNSFTITSQTTEPGEITFNNDGSKLYLVGTNVGEIFEYDLSINYDITTLVYNNKFLTSTDPAPTGITFNNDGSKLYIAGLLTGAIYEYTLTINYDISTASLNNDLIISTQDTIPTGITFNNDGSKFFFVGSQNDKIYQYNLSINYDITSSSFSKAFSIASQDTDPRGITFNNDGSKLYITGDINEKIYEYNLVDSRLETLICSDCNSFNLIINNLFDSIYNITWISTDANGQTNTTENFTIDTTKPTVTVNLPIEFNSYNDFNFSKYINFSDLNTPICTITISGESSTNCNQTDYNFTFNGNHTFNITVTDIVGNTNTSINNIMLINPFQTFQFTQLNGSSITNYTFGGTNFNTTASLKTYNNLINLGSNNITFSKLGFATTDIFFNINTTSNTIIISNITDSTIVLQIFDGNTNSLLTGLTIITVVATIGTNTTTTTGLVNISNINFVSGEYQIIAEHTGYGTETVFFNYDNQQILQKDIYMLNTSLSNVGTITIEVTADSGEFLENAICKALEWMPTLNSFVSVAEGKTNLNGQTNLNIHIGTEIYKFECSKSGITTTSSSQIIQTTGSILPIVLTGISTTPINTFGKLVTSLTNTTIDNTTQLLTYNFSDGNNLITEACISIYQRKGTKTTLLSQNCSSSSSGTIFKTININNTFDTYAIATVDNGITQTAVQQLVFKGIQALDFALNKYHFDILLPIIFTIIGIGIGLVLIPQNIFISVISSIIMVWVSVLIVPTIISSSIAIFITFICLLMIYGGQKR